MLGTFQNVGNIPLEPIREVYAFAYEELRQREEITYQQKLHAEKGYNTTTLECFKTLK